jgi:Cd2+/Zn2+-exporting ATPase
VKVIVSAKSVLPQVPHAHDQCIEQFQRLIAAKVGIDKVHIVESESDATGSFCIHFDPAKISLAQVRDFAQRVGSELDHRYGHLQLQMSATYAHRARAFELRLAAIDGVIEAVVTPDGALRVEYDRGRTNENAIRESVRLPLEPSEAIESTRPDEIEHVHDHGHHHHDHHHDFFSAIFGHQTQLIFAILSGVFFVGGWTLAHAANLPAWAIKAIYVVSYFFGGYYAAVESIEKLKHRKLEVDSLMIVAAVGAATMGSWAEGALLLFLFSIGHSLEAYAMGRAKAAIESLARISPKTAHVLRDGLDIEIPVDQLIVGDIVIVKPDERVPADGFVIEGLSAIDQATITGESIPVEKQPVAERQAARRVPDAVDHLSRVYAGTINGEGGLKIEVTKLTGETMLARVIAMVNEAQTRSSPNQQLAKKFERYFVPTVMAFLLILLAAPIVIDEPFSKSFYRCMSVAVAASPCALAISTPSAVLSAIARAARAGVLVKGGGPLEALGQIDTIAFDKTGTLTQGTPAITDVWTCEGTDQTELLSVAIGLEQMSSHPLARAIVRDAGKRLLQENGSTLIAEVASDVQSITGQGIQGVIDGRTVSIGNRRLFQSVQAAALPKELEDTVSSLERSGRTIMIVQRADRYLGVIGLMDQPRETAKRVVEQLRNVGIRRMIMISGDNPTVANAVASAIGLDEARGDLMPDDKVSEVQKMSRQSKVAMVGDGVNDAPAMAVASVGIAMGAAGSDVALETADIALMSDNLELLPFAIMLGRATSQVIRQNLWISMGMVAFLVPSTLLGLSIGPAVVLHEGSTVVVILNALRLLRFASD